MTFILYILYCVYTYIYKILHINAHIWNLERRYWQSYMQGSRADTDVKNRLLDSVEEGKGGMIWGNSIEMYITICKIYDQWKFDTWSRAPRVSTLDNPEGQGGEAGGREVQDEGGHVFCSVQSLRRVRLSAMPGLPVHHQLLEFTQTHAHRVGDAIQPSHPLSSPSPPALNPSQHQGLFQWVNSSHEVTKALEFQLHTCIPVVNSCWCIAKNHHNIVKQLCSH